MRSIWKGAISFGLVSIGVKLYSATEEKSIAFHQVHREDGGRIRYKRVCQLDGEEVSYGDIAKGYELSSGEMVVLTDDDLADLPLSTSRAIDVLTFVPLEQVDPIYFAKSYYLEPDKNAGKPYVLLRDALSQSGRIAIVKVALRQRESLATLRVRDDVLVLETMSWPDEVRSPNFDFLDDDVNVRPQELQMAESLIESMTGDFDPSAYSDQYREALEQVIQAKIEGREVVEPQGEEEQPAGVIDLMAALRASVDRAKAARGGEAAGESAEATGSDGADGAATKSAKTTKKASKKSAGKSAKTASAKSATSTASTKSAKSAEKSAKPKKTAAKATKSTKRTASRRSA